MGSSPLPFFAALHRESGDRLDRHFWGYFSADGTRSVWTLGLATEEAEDNHQIAKKLRKLKASLDKIFKGSDLIPEGKQSFSDTLIGEQFRFVEEAIFAQGSPPEAPLSMKQVSGIQFMTDAYGPARALQQVGHALLDAEIPQALPVLAEMV